VRVSGDAKIVARRRHRLAFWIAGLALLDAVAFACVPAAALIVRFGGKVPIEHAVPYMWFMPVLGLWRFFTAVLCDLYNFRNRLTLADFIFNAAGAALLSIAGGYFFLASVQLYYLPETQLSRFTSALDALGLFAWFVVSRWAMLKVLRARGYRVHLFVLGANDAHGALTAEIRAHAPAMLQVSESDASLPMNDQIAQLQASGLVDQIVVADVELAQQELNALLRNCERNGADLYLLPGVNMSIIASTRVSSIAGLPLVPLQPTFLASVYRPIKRAIDIVVAATLLLTCAPFALIIALLVRMESPGPVIFSQERVGLHGRRFRVHKFRTMIANAEAESGPVLSPSGDPRITRLGRIMRKYRIDEWPQFWNVLMGDMSLVGPRPERPEFIEKFIAENPLYERRFLVQPGLTGLAQIHGRYDSDYLHKLRYDLIYINSISPIADARILLATIRTVLTAHGAQ